MTLTPPIAMITLCLLAALLWVFVRKDRSEYQAFKALSDSAARSRYFRLWLVRSAAGFAGTSLVLLLVFGRLGSVVELPSAFSGLRDQLSLSLGDELAEVTWPVVEGFAIGLLMPLVVILAVQRVRRDPRISPRRVLVGDVEPLLPRSFVEGVYGALLSINAGVSEELFFRLLLPSLWLAVIPDAAWAFALSALAFGAMHSYQGWPGVLGSTLLGGLLTLVYVATGQLWIAMLVHAVLDLRTLVVMPCLEWLAAPSAAASKQV